MLKIEIKIIHAVRYHGFIWYSERQILILCSFAISADGSLVALQLCPTSTVYQKVTETQVVPTYVTKTLERYVTEYETQVQTQYQTVATTVVQPSYVTETEYKTNFKTNYETEYLTETVHKTQTIHSTYTQVKHPCIVTD